MIKHLLLITCCALIKPASADQMTAGELLDFCTSSADKSEIACRFYVLGITEALPMGYDTHKNQDGTFSAKKSTILCIPDEIGNYELVGHISNEMRKLFTLYPADSKLPAVSIVAAVLHRRYPCSK